MMESSSEDSKRSSKKATTGGSFFSVSLPAALQRVFKKNSSETAVCDNNITVLPAEDDVKEASMEERVNIIPCVLDEVPGDSADNSIVFKLLSPERDQLCMERHEPSFVGHDADDEQVNLIQSGNKQVVPLKSILVSGTSSPRIDEKDAQVVPKKTVTFNVTVISETYGPPNPTSKERHVDTIISDYTKFCEKYKVKPIEKLIKQIREFRLIEKREVKIDLKGVRLDYKQCECLEAVFRRVRVLWLDLSNTFLEDDSCTSICEMCEYYDTATNICLSGNTRIGIRGWLAVSQLIQKSSCLQYLDLSRTIFTEQILQVIARAFRVLTPLKILHLEGCYLNGSRLQNLLSSIVYNKNIHELYLAENKLSANDANTLFDLLLGNSTLKVLDLRNNSLQDAGFLKLCQGLLQQSRGGVEMLHLWNNNITSNSIQGFVHVLTIHPSLHTINLGKNKIGDEGIMTMKFNLIKNKRLKRLGLCNNRITNTGAVALAELIADTQQLLRLDLRENTIGLAGLIALSQAMQINYSVFKLDLNRNIKVEPQMNDLVKRLSEDIRICCLRNRQLSKGGPLDEIMSLTSVLSDDHSITESLKTLPPSQLPSPQKSLDGSVTSFWQLINRFTRAKQTTTMESLVNDASKNSSTTNPSQEHEPLTTDSSLTHKIDTVVINDTQLLKDGIVKEGDPETNLSTIPNIDSIYDRASKSTHHDTSQSHSETENNEQAPTINLYDETVNTSVKARTMHPPSPSTSSRSSEVGRFSIITRSGNDLNFSTATNPAPFNSSITVPCSTNGNGNKSAEGSKRRSSLPSAPIVTSEKNNKEPTMTVTTERSERDVAEADKTDD